LTGVMFLVCKPWDCGPPSLSVCECAHACCCPRDTNLHQRGGPPLPRRMGQLRATLTRQLPALPSHCVWVLSQGVELEAGGRLVRDADTAGGLCLRSHDCLYISILKIVSSGQPAAEAASPS
jgi:hypothetical protein